MTTGWPPRGEVWIYRGAGWAKGQLVRVERGGKSAIVRCAKAGSRELIEQRVYDSRNVCKEKPKSGQQYL